MPAYKPIETAPGSLRDLALSISLDLSGANKFRQFQRLYANDRTAFVYDIMPELAKTITDYQLEILGYFDNGNSRVAVRGPHGLGKTFIASLLVHHGVLTSEEDAKIPTTASAWRQLEKYLWPEIRKVSKFINWTEVGRQPYDMRSEFMQDSIRLSGGIVEAFAVSSDDHNTIEGCHASRLIYIFDEAKSIPRATWDAAEGAFANAGLKIPITEQPFEGISIADTIENIDRNDPYILNNSPENISIPITDMPIQGKGISKISAIGEYSNKDIHSPIAIDIDSIRKGSNRDIDIKDSIAIGSNYIEDSTKDITIREKVIGFNPQQPSTLIPTNPIIPIYPTGLVGVHAEPIVPISYSNKAYEALAFAISTPGDPSGQFYDIHMRKRGFEDWIVRHVTLDEAIRAGRISKDWSDQRAIQWGVDSAIYQNRVLGEFADMSEEGMIPLSHIRIAVERWKTYNAKGFPGMLDGKRTMGIDTARAGDDKTVLALRHASVITDIKAFSKLSVTSTAGRIQALADNRYLHIETDGGLGAAVYDILKQEGVPNLRPITVGGKTNFRDHSKELSFANVRSAMWWNMREILEPASGIEVCLPPIQELILDLCTPTYDISRGAIVQLEGKDSILKRIGRSTDYGDAVCLAFWIQSSGGGAVV
jgi:hypothetical protein